MLKVKVFSSTRSDDLESTLQDWLNANSHIEIFHLAQSQNLGWVTITLLYK